MNLKEIVFRGNGYDITTEEQIYGKIKEHNTI